MNTTVDGEFQRYTVESGAYIRDHFFGPDPRLRKLVEHLTDDELRNLPRGGHDYRKLYAAYKAATENLGTGAPTVILAKTIKGWTLGPGVEGRNATHQIKKMTDDQLMVLRDRLYLHDEIPDEALEGDDPPYYRPPEDSVEYQYMMERRRALDGSLPAPQHPRAPAARAAGRQRRSPSCSPARARRRCRTTMALHPPAAQPRPRRADRPADRADHPRRGPHVRHGRAVPRAQDLRRAGPEVRAGRPRPAALLHRGRATARSSRRASPRPARWRASSPPARRTPPAACRWCRSTSSIRCSGSSGSATSSGRPPTPAPAASCSAPPPGARRCSARACSTRTATARARLDRAAVPGLRPGLRLRGGDDRQARPPPHVRRPTADEPTSSTTSPSTTRTTRCRRCPTRARRHVEDGDRRGPLPVGTAPRRTGATATVLFSGSAQGAAAPGRRPSWPSTTTSASSCGRRTVYKALREEALDVERWNRLHPGQPARDARW